MIFKILPTIVVVALLSACVTSGKTRRESRWLPSSFVGSTDTTNIVRINWKEYFADEYLNALIDSALARNQELNIVLQEIEISKNEIREKKGEYLPSAGIRVEPGIEKEGRYTRHGAVDESLEIKPGTHFPEPLQDYLIGPYASWELDIWKKLRNAKKAAQMRYLASQEGRNFMVTNLISEIAADYYELLALVNMLEIIERNIEIQKNGLNIVKQQKDAARVTQLAVNRFAAQVLHTTNLQYEIRQKIFETENHLCFLTGSFPHRIQRKASNLYVPVSDSVLAGIPAQLLANRADIRQAELKLAAAKLDVQVAKAAFYPSFSIAASTGFQAFKPSYLFRPQSILYNLAGELMAPLINRNALHAQYRSANARQVQQVFEYEKAVLNAYIDVLNQLAAVKNYAGSFESKSQEADLLQKSVAISDNLFGSARADYLEVLLTQREALEAKMELIEIRQKLLNSKVNVYRALGGGWN